MRRALFLFNHDAGHQVAHLAGVAAALARDHGDITAIIAHAPGSVDARLRQLIPQVDADRMEWRKLALPRWARMLSAPLDKVLPASRLLRLRCNEDLFAGADVIVSTERTCLRLQHRLPAATMPRFAHIPHGAGDRSVAWHPDLARFDLCLLAGQKVFDQFTGHGIPASRLAIVGYPKFESVDASAKPDFFGNGRPTFTYNPHFDPHLSSWYDAGPDILRWFAGPAGRNYNLIFAPHVMLFRKRLHISPEYRTARFRPEIPAEARSAPNILIDTNGPRLFDMSYMLGCDGYIGDVSSQIYEFLLHPRPAFFVDCRRNPRAEDDQWHLFWKAGPIVHDAAALAALIPDYATIGESYRPAQDQIFSYTIDSGDRPSSARAAVAIAELARAHG